MATIQEQMKANSEKWWTASPTEKKQLEAANQSLGKQTGLSYNSSSGTWNNPSGTQAYTVNSGSSGGSGSGGGYGSGSSGGGSSPNPSAYPSYLTGVTGNKDGTWQERLRHYYDNPGEVAAEITRAGGINTPDANDWVNKLSPIIPGYSQVLGNQTPVSGQGNLPPGNPPTTTPPVTVQSQGNNSDALARLQKIFDQYAQNSTTRQQTLQDLLTASPTYKAPTADEMLAQSRQYAGLQVDPVLSAIQSRLSGARTSATNARTATEAAYAGVPAQTQARLEEARRYALENAISRGMGRSGVVEWNNAKLSAPIIQAETESEREKAAKLSAIANELANTESETGRLTQETEARRGALESARLTELQQLAQQLAAQDQQTRFNQGQAWANYGSQSDLAQASIRMLMEDLLRNG